MKKKDHSGQDSGEKWEFKKGWLGEIEMKQGKHLFSYEYLSKYRNVLMGLQIILIIIFHFTEDAYSVRDSHLIYLFYKYIRSSGVDMFLLLSGIGLYFSWKRKPEAKVFYIKRFTRILIPYFIIAVPAWIWLDIFYEYKGWTVFVQDLFFITFFTEGTRWFWYILIASFCYWIFPYVYTVVETTADRISAQMRVLLLCVTSTVIVMLLQLYSNELYKYMSIAVTRIPAFLIGVLIGKAVYEKRKVTVSRVCLMAVLAVVIAWPFQMVSSKIIGVYSRAFLNYVLSLVFVLILAYLSGRKSMIANKLHGITVTVFSWFGKYTLELYLIHVMVRKVMKNIGLPTYRLSNEVLLIIISIILSLIVNKLAEYIQKRIIGRMNAKM